MCVCDCGGGVGGGVTEEERKGGALTLGPLRRTINKLLSVVQAADANMNTGDEFANEYT